MAQQYTDDALQEALRATRGGISKNQAAKTYGIPRQTLQYRMKEEKFPMCVAKEKDQRLCRNRERKVCDWALALAGRRKPPTYPQIVEYVSCMLEKGGDDRPLGKNWINSFIHRYPIVKIIKYRKTKRPQKVTTRRVTTRRVTTRRVEREASDDGEVTTPMEEKANGNGGSVTAPPRNPEAHQKEITLNHEAKTPGNGKPTPSAEINECSSNNIVPNEFWEPAELSQESLESFKAALKTRVKGLPRQIPGVRLLARSELLARGKSPPVTIVHTETNRRGVKVPSIQHVDSTSPPSSHQGETMVNHMLAEEQDASSRIRGGRGHTRLEWAECQHMSIYLVEQGSDSKGSPQWVSWQSRDTDGRITGDRKPNSEIKTQRLGQIFGRSWFYCPLNPVLNLKSAFFIYNQIKFRGVESYEKVDILPVIFVTAYAGPNPEKTWKRYISSYNGQAHIQFHASYITPNPPSTITQPIELEHGHGFGFRRDSYTLLGMNGSSSSLLEGRISIAIRTTTDTAQSLYSAVTLAESDTFQEAAPGKVWDEEFRPLNCGLFTGIAVFQSMLYRVIQFCKEENTKTIKSIPPRSSWLDGMGKEKTEKLINAVCDIIDRTTRGIKKLAKDCQETTKDIVKLAEDHRAEDYNLRIAERWDSLITSQKKIHEELASMILDIYDEDERQGGTPQ